MSLSLVRSSGKFCTTSLLFSQESLSTVKPATAFTAWMLLKVWSKVRMLSAVVEVQMLLALLALPLIGDLPSWV